MTQTNTLSLEQRIRRFATHHCEEHRDQCDEVNLTALGEQIISEFDLTDEEFKDVDGFFVIWHELDRAKLL